MKRTKVLVSCIIAVLLFFVFSEKSKAITMGCQAPDSVKSGQSFRVVINFSENVTAITGHILYDNSLLEVDASSSPNLTKINTGDVVMAVIAEESNYTSSYSIPFTAKDVESTTTANFTLSDFAFAGESFEQGEFNQAYSILIEADQQSEEVPLTISSATIDLKVGESGKITATGNGDITWISNDENIATVSDGTITGVSAGSTTVTVRDSLGKQLTVTVTVEADNGNQGGGGNSGDNGNGGNSGSGENNQSGGNGGSQNSNEGNGSSGDNGSSGKTTTDSNTESSTKTTTTTKTSSSSPKKLAQTGDTFAIVGVIAIVVIAVFVFRKKSK